MGTINKQTFEISNNEPIDANLPTDLCNDLENWMTNLPKQLRKTPLIHLSIPGSHDSFTNNINSDSSLSPDAEDIVKALSFCGKPLRAIMSKWAKTQAYDATKQLHAGIRYFDLRVATKPDDDLHIVHGQYSTLVFKVLEEINAFLESHAHEVVILDFQHFYAISNEDHLSLIQLINDIFQFKIVKYTQYMKHLDLVYLTEEFNFQVLVIYRAQIIHPFWPSGCLPTPWPNTMNKNVLCKFLSENLSKRNMSYGFVTQFLLTPKPKTIVFNLFSSNKKSCAIPLLKDKLSWIEEQKPGLNGVNVIVSDFINLDNALIIRTIINLNLKLLTRSPSKYSTKNILAPVDT